MESNKKQMPTGYDPRVFSKDSKPAPVSPAPFLGTKVFEINGKRVDVFFEKTGMKEIKVSCASKDEFTAFYSELCKIRTNLNTLCNLKKEDYLTIYADDLFWKDIKDLEDQCLKNAFTPTPIS